MKKSKFVFLSSALMATAFVVTACGGSSGGGGGGGGGGGESGPKFNFVPIFESGKTDRLFKGTDEELTMVEFNKTEDKTYSYTVRDVTIDGVTYKASDYVEVKANPKGKSNEFIVSPKKATLTTNNDTFTLTINFSTTDKEELVKKNVFITIGERYAAANTGYNFSSDTEKKEEILGKLEEYAMKNYLTGITLFENGGYVRYSPRVVLPTEKYITGYGFGLLTEGELDYDKWTPAISGDEDHKKYLQSAASSDPGNISGWNAEGSQVSDLYGYITSSFWGTKMNEERDGYVWYPILAADNCEDPVPQDGEPTDKIHKVYRVYVKTGQEGGIFYNYVPEMKPNGEPVEGAKYHRRAVELEDYLTTFQVLLTQSCDLFRGAEFAGDTSYGLKGAYSYFRKTKGATAEQAETYWADMQANDKLGIKTGTDAKGDYIEFEFLNPIDQFTAKYTLSSNLYSPLPKEFLNKIGGDGGWVKGAYNFGTGSKNGASDKGEGSILANVLSVGPFYLESWESEQEHYFKRDDQWFEYAKPAKWSDKRYKIPGVHIRVVSAATQNDTAIYSEFNKGTFDSTGIPTSIFKQEKLDTDLKVEGDSTFKLNVNSLDQDTWDDMFLPGGPEKYKDVKKAPLHYQVRPWMSNRHFLNGLFWSINRKEFAKDRGVTASSDYFSDAYLSDPVNGISYNKTDTHKAAQDAFDPYLRSTTGYDQSKATSEFNLAITELVSEGVVSLGTKANPTHININIDWMYSTDKTTYGEDIAQYFQKAFNGNVGEGLIVLDVTHSNGADWQQVYNDHLQVGCFDLGFGAISGNTLSPLNFLEVLKSDNSSGFTLNWGTDTSVVDENDPIVFEVEEPDPNDSSKTISVKKEWSFDAAWAAADHGSIVKDGQAVDSVNYGYTTAPTKDGQGVNRLANGATMFCPFDFVHIDEGASFEITRIEIVLVGAGSLSIDLKSVTDKLKKWVTIKTVDGKPGVEIVFDNTEYYDTDKDIDDPTKEKDYTLAGWINKELYFGLKHDKQIKPDTPAEDIEDLKNPFAYNYYYSDGNPSSFWYIEVWYNITIKGSVPTENSYSVRMSAPSGSETDRSMSFAKQKGVCYI